MKILHLSTSKEFRGGERQLLWIHNGLISKGISSSLLCSKKCDELTNIENSFPIDITVTSLLKNIIQLKPTIIHAHDSKALTLVSLLSLFYKPYKIIYSKKTIFPISSNFLSSLKYSRIDTLIGVSQSAIDVVRDRFSNSNCVKIVDGIDVIPSLDRDTARAELSISENEKVFASVGYFSGEKNIGLLIKVAERINTIGNYKLLIIGSIDTNAKEILKNNDSVLLTGVINNPAKYYSAFDCYLSTSTREGLGSALLDAVVRDIPTIALNSGGSQEIFDKDDNAHCSSEEGFLQAIQNFINGTFDFESVKIRGEKARDKFSVEKMVNSHIDIYQSVG